MLTQKKSFNTRKPTPQVRRAGRNPWRRFPPKKSAKTGEFARSVVHRALFFTLALQFAEAESTHPTNTHQSWLHRYIYLWYNPSVYKKAHFQLAEYLGWLPPHFINMFVYLGSVGEYERVALRGNWLPCLNCLFPPRSCHLHCFPPDACKPLPQLFPRFHCKSQYFFLRWSII